MNTQEVTLVTLLPRLLAAGCACGLFALAVSVSGVPAASPPVDEAEQVAATRERLGKALLAILADSRQPASKRVQSARVLGRLQFAPAIPALIAAVDLKDPAGESSEARPDLQYPCVRALADLGEAATAKIVEAHLREESAVRQMLLRTAIQLSGTRDAAIVYAKGIAARDNDLKTTRKVNAFIEALK